MKKLYSGFFFLILPCSCQLPVSYQSPQEPSKYSCRIMFWNPENLFDCYNDSLTADDEFLPYGIRAWNQERYNRKLMNVCKVIIAAGGWEPPEIIGLCEVENKRVLFDLLEKTPFSYYGYRFVHHDSPDRRGIDVAMIYDPGRARVISERPIKMELPDSSFAGTRDVLYVRLLLHNKDTVSLFLNHWPSKYGGAGSTADSRINAARVLSHEIGELIRKFPSEKIILMGDFNDTPESEPVRFLVHSPVDLTTNVRLSLINLSEGCKGALQGTIKFQGAWEMIDQVIVSSNILDQKSISSNSQGRIRIFSPDFMLVRDEKYGGMKPNRTYNGMAYNGGFSDHLPVILELFPN